MIEPANMKFALQNMPLPHATWSIEPPAGTEFLCVRMVADLPRLFYRTPLEWNERQRFLISVYRDGEQMPEIAREHYFDTYQMPGDLVFHVFIEPRTA